MKYILTTGCSFTNNLRLNPDDIHNNPEPTRQSWPYHLQNHLGTEYKVLNYGGATNDNVSMCRIILYHIDRLLKEGVSPKDISVAIQWSDATRQAFYFHKQMDKQHHHIGHTLVYHNNWETKPGLFFLTGGFSPPTGEDSAINWLNIENSIKFYELEINWDSIVNQAMHWFELWILLEKTCKELGINTYYMSMRDIFTINSGSNFLDRNEGPKFWINKVEVLKPYIDKLPIESEKYWHYKDFKGLLEWAIDNRSDDIPVFQEFSFNKVNSYDEYLKIQPNGWGHPSSEMMDKWVREEFINILKI
jgi:hypothetical protein